MVERLAEAYGMSQNDYLKAVAAALQWLKT